MRLITNGLIMANRPEKLPADFWNACRECNVTISVTAYPIKTDIERIKELCEKNGVQFEIFRTRQGDRAFTRSRLRTDGKGSIMNYYRCEQYKCWQICGDKIYGCPQAAYASFLNERFGTSFEHRRGDYLSIGRLTRFKMWLYRLFPRPFCRYCEFPREKIGWQANNVEAEDWIYYHDRP